MVRQEDRPDDMHERASLVPIVLLFMRMQLKKNVCFDLVLGF